MKLQGSNEQAVMRKREPISLVNLSTGAQPLVFGESGTYDKELEEAVIRPVGIIKDSVLRKCS